MAYGKVTLMCCLFGNVANYGKDTKDLYKVNVDSYMQVETEFMKKDGIDNNLN